MKVPSCYTLTHCILGTYCDKSLPYFLSRTLLKHNSISDKGLTHTFNKLTIMHFTLQFYQFSMHLSIICSTGNLVNYSIWFWCLSLTNIG